MIILGLDIGEKRIGVAKSDELGWFAHGLGYIERVSDELFITKLKEYIEEFKPACIVVGLPKQLDGTDGIAAQKVYALVEMVRAHVQVAIEFWDERLTTKAASRYLCQTKVSGSKKRKKVDQLAAQIMLQDYLDAKKGTI